MLESAQLIDFIKINALRLIGIIICLIPVFFGINVSFITDFYSYFLNIQFVELIIFVFLLCFLTFISIFIGYIFFFLFYYVKPLDMKKIVSHPMINLHLETTYKTKNASHVIGGFTLSMIFEELLFRYYILGSILNITLFECPSTFDFSIIYPNLSFIIFSSAIFAGYHIHIYFSTKSNLITSLFIIVSFLLGMVFGIVFLYIGVI